MQLRAALRTSLTGLPKLISRDTTTAKREKEEEKIRELHGQNFTVTVSEEALILLWNSESSFHYKPLDYKETA